MTQLFNRNDLSPFFGNDGRAELFIKLFLVNFNKSINEDNPDSIVDGAPFAYNLMRSMNYENKMSEMDDNDVHTDFSDFIFNTGSFHRLINNNNIPITNPLRQQAMNIMLDVLRNWNKLSQHAKEFYIMYVAFKHNGKTLSYAELNQLNDPNIDTKNYSAELYIQDNVITQNDQSISCPSFYRLLPKTPSFMKKVWFIENGTSKYFSLLNHPNKYDFIKALYCGAYIHDDKNVSIWKYEPNAIFHLNTSKVIRDRLYQVRQELNQKQPQIDQNASYISLADKNIWKFDQQGLYKESLESPNGKIYYNTNDPATINALTANFKCYSSLLKGNRDECEKYMDKCILSNDIRGLDECKKFWSRKDEFYNVAKNEISQMHPMIALRTLQKFGFREHEVYDSVSKMNIKKVETVDHWITNQLSKQFTDIELVNIIKTNDKLLEYLKLLVEYINANPAILNSSFNSSNNGNNNIGTSESRGIFEPSEFARKIGIKVQLVPTSQALLSMRQNELTLLRERLRQNYETNKMNVEMNKIIFPNFNVAYPNINNINNINVMMGGAFGDILNEPKKMSGAEVLYAIIRNDLAELETRGKKLSQDEINRLTKLMDRLKANEDELVKIDIYLREFRNYVSIFEREPKVETLSVNAIEDLINKKKSLLEKQYTNETSLLSILESIQKTLDECIANKNQSNDNTEYKPIDIGK